MENLNIQDMRVRYLKEALRRHSSPEKAAVALGISNKSVYLWMCQYNINR